MRITLNKDDRVYTILYAEEAIYLLSDISAITYEKINDDLKGDYIIVHSVDDKDYYFIGAELDKITITTDDEFYEYLEKTHDTLMSIKTHYSLHVKESSLT